MVKDINAKIPCTEHNVGIFTMDTRIQTQITDQVGVGLVNMHIYKRTQSQEQLVLLLDSTKTK